MYFSWPPLAIAAACAITFSHMWTRILRDHAHCLAWIGLYILVMLPLFLLAFRWLWYGHIESPLDESLSGKEHAGGCERVGTSREEIFCTRLFRMMHTVCTNTQCVYTLYKYSTCRYFCHVNEKMPAVDILNILKPFNEDKWGHGVACLCA